MPEGITTTTLPSPLPEQAAPASSSRPEPDSWGAAWRRWRPSVMVGFGTWLTALAVYVMITAVAWMPMEGVQVKDGNEVPPAPNSFAEALASWNQWDTVWYRIIADSGYTWDERSTAFFPLYPMLMRTVDPLLPGGSLEAGLIISLLACLVALIVVHRLAAEILDREGARRATFYLIAFPTGFYLAAAYNESLFLALTVGALYAMRKGRWWWAGLLAGYASATRMAGVVLAAAFLYEYGRQHRWMPRLIGAVRDWSGQGAAGTREPRRPAVAVERRLLSAAASVRGEHRPDAGSGLSDRQPRLRRWHRAIQASPLGVLLVPVGLLLYCAYLWETFGDPLHFLRSQEAWFRTGFMAPWNSMGLAVDLIINADPVLHGDNLRNIFNLGTTIAILTLLTLALIGPWKLGRENAYLVIFSAAIVMMPLLNPLQGTVYPLSSMWRFALECLPAFLVLAKMGRNQHFDRTYLAVALALQGTMIVTFLHSKFVA